MKKTLSLIAILLTTSFAFAGGKQLKDFKILMDELKGGKQVGLVIHYAKCSLEIDGEIQETSPGVIGGMTIDVYEYFARGVVYNQRAFVVFSKSKLISNPLGEGYVYNYVKLKVYEDNRVEITARYLNALTLEVEMEETFRSFIHNGKNDAGVHFYRLR